MNFVARNLVEFCQRPMNLTGVRVLLAATPFSPTGHVLKPFKIVLV